MAPSLESQQLMTAQGGVEQEEIASETNTVINQLDDKYRVTIVGSGNWGSVAAKLIASNTLKLPSFYGL